MRKGAVPMMNHEAELVYAGIDTHADTHHVAVIGAHGRELGDTQVPATAAGYRQVLAFLARWPAPACRPARGRGSRSPPRGGYRRGCRCPRRPARPRGSSWE